MVCGLTAAGIAGAGIPLLMKRWGFDPAQSSGIFLTTVTDVASFFSFLAFASLFERHLR
jgi:magnesium transporter